MEKPGPRPSIRGKADRAFDVSSRPGPTIVPIEMPRSDPAFPILEGLLSVVPASRWSFARVEPNGDLFSHFGSSVRGDGLAGLADEFKRQRGKVASGARIAATLGPLEEYASGVTLLFADERTDYGILTLLRTAELGPYTSSEISMLTFALDAASDRLCEIRLQPTVIGTPLLFSDAFAVDDLAPNYEAFYVLDDDLRIVLAWTSEDETRVAMTGLDTRLADRLPPVIERAVRELTAGTPDGARIRAGVSRPVSFLVVRTQPLSGPAGLFIGVHIDRFRPSNSLTLAAGRFRITPREVQVLALLLDGKHLDEIAKTLNITSSTVQDHIKSMLDKTESINRSELIARVLGWQAPPNAKRP